MMKRTLAVALALMCGLLTWTLAESVPGSTPEVAPMITFMPNDAQVPPVEAPEASPEPGVAASATPTATGAPGVTASMSPEGTADPGNVVSATPEAATEPGIATSATPEATVQPTAEPTPEPGRLAGLIIGIDPGHQAHGNYKKEAVAPGSRQTKAKVSDGTEGVATGIPEYVTVLEIAFKLREALLEEGATVYMTRETHDVDISNQERAAMMNALGCHLVLRIHCDGAESRSPRGIGLFVNESFPISAESFRAAECLLPRMAEATGANPRGVFESDTYTGLNWSQVPCILVECGYMSNPDEDRLLNDPVYQYRLATGMVEGICDYFGRG